MLDINIVYYLEKIIAIYNNNINRSCLSCREYNLYGNMESNSFLLCPQFKFHNTKYLFS